MARAERVAKRRPRVDGRHGQHQPDRQRPPDSACTAGYPMPMPDQRDQPVLGREVVEVAGVQEQRVDHALLHALEAGERMPGDDVGLLEHADELRRQDQRRWARPTAARVTTSASRPRTGCRSASSSHQRHQEQDDDESAGEVHRQDTDQRQHGHRDAVAVPQRRGDQHEGRDRDPVGGQVGHRGDAEFDVGHRGERRRQRRRGGGRPGGAPLRWSPGAAGARSGSPRWTGTARPTRPANSGCSRWSVPRR